jgi:hypothetical protein
LITDGKQAGSQVPFRAHERRAQRLAVGCLGAVLAAGAGCNDTSVDFLNPDLGLLAHWALDESQPGSVAIDASGFGNHGTPSLDPPVPTQHVPPVHFRDRFSLSFNGQDQWIEIGNPPLLNVGGPISAAAWVRPASIDSRGNILAHGYRFGPSYDFALRVDAGTYVFTTWDSINHQAVATIPTSDIGTWVHLCGVFDGATYRLYRNGTLAATTADATAPQANIDATWAIGARAPQQDSGVDNLIQADVDDVRIYGRALSSAEVEALYRR